MTRRADHRQADISRALNLPYLQREIARGKTFWYVRRGRGKRIRIYDKYGSSEFIANYHAALGGELGAKLRSPRRPIPSVYFIVAGNAVKIGISNNVIKRAKDLQTGHSGRVQIVHTIPGDRALERSLHNKFKDSHVRGKWFSYAGAIAEFIESDKRAA